jgi:hypothetical protein
MTPVKFTLLTTMFRIRYEVNKNRISGDGVMKDQT